MNSVPRTLVYSAPGRETAAALHALLPTQKTNLTAPGETVKKGKKKCKCPTLISFASCFSLKNQRMGHFSFKSIGHTKGFFLFVSFVFFLEIVLKNK